MWRFSTIVDRIWTILSSWWTLAVLVAATVGGLAYTLSEANVLVPVFGRSAQTMGAQVFAMIAGSLLLAWFILSRNITFRTRFVGLTIIAAIGIAAWASVRKVSYNGNNIPIFEFVWSPTFEDRLSSAGLDGDDIHAESKLVDLDPTELDGPACPGFLGSRHDGYVDAVSLPETLVEPKEIWRRPVGGGYSACVIEGNVAVTIEQRGQDEVVTSYEVPSGKPLWHYGYQALFSEAMGGDGPRATPTIDGDRVYALGATGVLTSFELATGKLQWERNILDDAGVKNITWGMSGSPLVTERLVVVNPGGMSDKGVIAYDQESGEIVWAKGIHPAGYSSPELVTLAETPQILVLTANALVSHDLESGEELWSAPFEPMNGIAASQPIAVPGDRVFISASYGAGCQMLQVSKSEDGWKAEKVWDNQLMRCKFSSPIYVDGFLYGLDDGILVCLNADTGKRKWKGGRYGHGQMLYADQKLFIQAEDGEFVVVATDPSKHRELLRWRALPGIKNWNAPAIAGDRLLVRNHEEMACYQFPAEQTKDLTPAAN